MERLRILLPATLIFLAWSGGAQAAKVSAPEVEQYPGAEIEATAMFVGEPGEANDVTVTESGSSADVMDEDAGAPITAGENCESLDEHTARCFGPITVVDTRLADGDDTIHMVTATDGSPLYALASGGSGDDHLFGSAEFEFLDGNAGEDTVEGGGGDDWIDGGADADDLSGDDGSDHIDGGTGTDHLNGGEGGDRLNGEGENVLPAGADTIEGGPGEDLVSYYLRPKRIDVDLARGTGNGAEGEGDVLSGIEDVEGSYGGGRIAGDAGPNRLVAGIADAPTVLSGRGGDDTLVGGFEDDVLSGGYGDDVLRGWGDNRFHGGAGADELQTQSLGGSGVDRGISCGPDEDIVSTADYEDLIPRSCERARLDRGFQVSPLLRRAEGAAILIDLERPRGLRRCRAVVGLYGPAPAGATEEPRKIAFGRFV
ncbi:MAG: hypothetical protein QOG52_436, partial [Frankiaceae bacterium]|nr:hypothetical protein [Frankiaceae bacterium]